MHASVNNIVVADCFKLRHYTQLPANGIYIITMQKIWNCLYSTFLLFISTLIYMYIVFRKKRYFFSEYIRILLNFRLRSFWFDEWSYDCVYNKTLETRKYQKNVISYVFKTWYLSWYIFCKINTISFFNICTIILYPIRIYLLISPNFDMVEKGKGFY